MNFTLQVIAGQWEANPYVEQPIKKAKKAAAVMQTTLGLRAQPKQLQPPQHDPKTPSRKASTHQDDRQTAKDVRAQLGQERAAKANIVIPSRESYPSAVDKGITTKQCQQEEAGSKKSQCPKKPRYSVSMDTAKTLEMQQESVASVKTHEQQKVAPREVEEPASEYRDGKPDSEASEPGGVRKKTWRDVSIQTLRRLYPSQSASKPSLPPSSKGLSKAKYAIFL